jgi:hypothetical protein
MLVDPQDLPAMVIDDAERGSNVDQARRLPQLGVPWSGKNKDYFGDFIVKKDSNTLRIGFQNIGGFSIKKGKLKDDTVRMGITQWDFDVFGFSETNIDWRLASEDDNLYSRCKEWWDTLHISSSNNTTSSPIQAHQYGGTALFSINKASHRVISKGVDGSKLGRWVWTRYRGCNNHTLRNIVGYRPNPPSGGPFTVYAQHRLFFNSLEEDGCPRAAFLQDLSKEIEAFKAEGDHIILMLDGNSDMRSGEIHQSLTSCCLCEVILERHGKKKESTKCPD